jgi:hypothetical protein
MEVSGCVEPPALVRRRTSKRFVGSTESRPTSISTTPLEAAVSGTPQIHVIRHMVTLVTSASQSHDSTPNSRTNVAIRLLRRRGCDNLVGRDSVEPTNPRLKWDKRGLLVLSVSRMDPRLPRRSGAKADHFCHPSGSCRVRCLPRHLVAPEPGGEAKATRGGPAAP